MRELSIEEICSVSGCHDCGGDRWENIGFDLKVIKATAGQIKDAVDKLVNQVSEWLSGPVSSPQENTTQSISVTGSNGAMGMPMFPSADELRNFDQTKGIGNY